MREDATAGRPALLLSIVLIDAFSYSLILPILPSFILSAHGNAAWGGILVGGHALGFALASPILGIASDRHGAKPVLILTLLGSISAYAVLATAQSLGALLVARIFSGAMAGNLGVVQAAMVGGATGADAGKRLGLVMAGWSAGYVLGPAVGVALPEAELSPLLIPALVAGGATLLSTVGVILFFRSPSSPIAVPARQPIRSWKGQAPFLLLGMVAFCQAGLMAVTGFFCTSLFGWGPREISLLMLSCAIVIVAAQLLLVPFLFNRWRHSTVLSLSSLAIGLACLVAGLGGGQRVIGVGAVVFIFTAITIAQTAATALISGQAQKDEQGAALGAANGIAAVARIAGPVFLGSVFTLSPFAPFGVVAMLMIALLAVSVASMLRPGIAGNA